MVLIPRVSYNNTNRVILANYHRNQLQSWDFPKWDIFPIYNVTLETLIWSKMIASIFSLEKCLISINSPVFLIHKKCANHCCREFSHQNKKISKTKIGIQGVPRNMTVDEQFRMSSSKYWIRFKDFLQFSSLEISFTPRYLNL